MKRLVATMLAVLTCGTVFALPVGNPADPKLYTNHLWFGDCEWSDPCSPCSSWVDWFDLRLGYYGDCVYQRNLEVQDIGTIAQSSVNTNAGLIVVNICEWIDLFANVGASTFSIESPAVGTGVQLKLNFSPTLSYGGGGRMTFWSSDNFYVGVEGQYFYSKTELDSFEPLNTGAVTHFSDSNERNAKYGEWQVGLACAYRFTNSANFSMIPYAGIQFAGVDWQLNGVANPDLLTISNDLQEQRVTGWALGMTALLCDLVGVTVEGRWANETALSVIGQLSF